MAPTIPSKLAVEQIFEGGVVYVQFKMLNKGAFATLQVDMQTGEGLKAEYGAMVAMSPTIDVEGSLGGGLVKAMARSLLANEKFFFQTLTATRGPGSVWLAPSQMGDIQQIILDGSSGYIIQKDGFLACEHSIDIQTTMQNLLQGIFSGHGFFVLRAEGVGSLFVSSFGAIHGIDVHDELIVDTSHLVAWSDTLDYSIRKASRGWISSFVSGEGLVCRFRGHGRVYIQSRKPPKHIKKQQKQREKEKENNKKN